MKLFKHTRLAGLLLVAGLFYSCTQWQLTIDEHIANNDYEQALAQIDSELQDDPDQPLLYVQKAKIYGELAQNNEPDTRADYYAEASQNLNEAQQYGVDDMLSNTIDSLRQQFWKTEHNSGLQALDASTNENSFQIAAHHFENALIMRNDAMSTYLKFADVHYNMGNIGLALSTLNEALNYTDNPPIDIYHRLGYLYMESGEPEQAAYYYELAYNIAPDSNILNGLVNAYVSAGYHEKAVELLESSVQQNPDNASLRNVYGTQLYYITSDIIDDLKNAYRSNDSSLVNQIRFEAEGMGERAEGELIEAFKRDTTNINYIESLAVFYNNLAAQYLSLQEHAFSNHKTALQIKAQTLIDFAIDYYQKLVTEYPRESKYSVNLEKLKVLKNRTSDGS